MKITSGCRFAAASTAARPSLAVHVSCPLNVSSVASMSAESRLSSTIRVRSGGIAAGSVVVAWGSRAVGFRRDRQSYDELTSQTDSGAAHLHDAAVHFRERLHERQPYPEPGD